MNSLIPKRFIVKDLLLPVIIWAAIILAFLNVKNIPIEFNDTDHLVVRYLAKFLFTILFPLALIQLLYKEKGDFGIHFPKFSESFKLSIRAYMVGGPAGIVFLLIGLVGWTFADWGGALILSVVYLVVSYFIPIITEKLPTRDHIETPNHQITIFVFLSLATVVITYFTHEYVPVLSKILYYIFIVGLGEELLFRGYIQSSLNRYFGKPFTLRNVQFGWGLILSSLLFGLMHALVVTPPLWPWAFFTFALGLSLGYIREKDGSILSAVLLHAMFDMPLIFFT